jgi:hypothetical protein
MTKKQFFFWLFQIILVTFLGSLRFIEPTSGEEGSVRRTISVFISDHRLPIAAGLIFLVAVLTAWKELIAPRAKSKKLRQKIMGVLLEELCSGDKNNYRISIFRKARVLRRLHIYLIQAVDYWKAWRNGEKPAFLRGEYVYVSERLGTEHPNSKTFFHYTPDTARRCQGVAGACMQGLTDIAVTDLPNIDTLDLNTLDLKNKKLGATKLVRDYMSRGYVSDIQTLRRLHKKSRHIYGNILNNLEGDPRGVLVVDSFLDQPFLNEDVIKRLGHYATIIGATM